MEKAAGLNIAESQHGELANSIKRALDKKENWERGGRYVTRAKLGRVLKNKSSAKDIAEALKGLLANDEIQHREGVRPPAGGPLGLGSYRLCE
jgi:hypothetical protein